MSLPRVIGISGNPRRPSRIRTLVGAAVEDSARIDFRLYDRLDMSPSLGAATSRGNLPLPLAHLLDEIETADALIVGTPVCKGSYAGLIQSEPELALPAAAAGGGRIPSWTLWSHVL